MRDQSLHEMKEIRDDWRLKNTWKLVIKLIWRIPLQGEGGPLGLLENNFKGSRVLKLFHLVACSTTSVDFIEIFILIS